MRVGEKLHFPIIYTITRTKKRKKNFYALLYFFPQWSFCFPIVPIVYNFQENRNYAPELFMCYFLFLNELLKGLFF